MLKFVERRFAIEEDVTRDILIRRMKHGFFTRQHFSDPGNNAGHGTLQAIGTAKSAVSPAVMGRAVASHPVKNEYSQIPSKP